MTKPKQVPYMDKISLIVEFLNKANIPFEFVNIARPDGTIEGAGVMFRDVRWNKENILIYVDKDDINQVYDKNP